MPKVTLTDITTGLGGQATVNQNNQYIEDGFDNTLSRDGTGPNEMNSNLDMNGFQILNADFDLVGTDFTGVDLTGATGTDLGYVAATRDLTIATGTPVNLPLVATGFAGLAPSSPGGATSFLRADGTWQVPAAGGVTNLTWSAASSTVFSDTGTDAILTLADLTNPGLAPIRNGVATEYLSGTGVYSTPPDTSVNVTLAGAPTYLTIAGQVITRGLIDLTSHVTGDLPFANVAQIATASILGRNTGGTGDIEVLSAATLSAILNTGAALNHATLTNLTTGDPHTQYCLTAGDTMTGTLTTQALTVATTRLYDLGTNALRYKDIHAGVADFYDNQGTGAGRSITSGDSSTNFATMLGTNGTRTFALNPGTGIGQFSVGSVYNDTASTSAIFRNSGGGVMFGSVSVFSAEPAESVTLENLNTGLFYANGYAGLDIGAGTPTVLTATLNSTGGILIGQMGTINGGCTIEVTVDGGASGFIGSVEPQTSGVTARVLVPGTGSLAHLYVQRGVSTVSGNGCFVNGVCIPTNNTAGFNATADGVLINGIITGTGSMTGSQPGTTVLGRTTGAGSLIASGAGALVVASVGATTAEATAANSAQFGPGSNTQASSLQVGISGSGIAIKGTTGAFTSTNNGQIYIGGAGNVFVNVRSNGVIVQLGPVNTWTTGAHGTLRDFTGTTTAAQALQLLETLIEDLRTANII